MKKEVADADEVKVKRRLDENLQGRKEAYINKGMEAKEGCKGEKWKEGKEVESQSIKREGGKRRRDGEGGKEAKVMERVGEDKKLCEEDE